MATLEEKKRKLDEKHQKTILQIKIIKEQEKRQRLAKLSEVGKLSYKANIDQLDENLLFGAFLEIAKNAENPTQRELWQKNAKSFLVKPETLIQVFSIHFHEEPPKEVKDNLKEMKFRWNRFRKEYYGKCKKEILESLLKDCKAEIEEIHQ